MCLTQPPNLLHANSYANSNSLWIDKFDTWVYRLSITSHRTSLFLGYAVHDDQINHYIILDTPVVFCHNLRLDLTMIQSRGIITE